MATCVVCGDQQNAVIDAFGRFSIRECHACGVQFSDPLSYARASYDAAYGRSAAGASAGDVYVPCLRWAAEASPALDEARWFLNSAQELALRWLTRHLSPGAVVLDCGCGSGWFLGAAQRAGFRAFGADVGREAVALLQRKGFSVVCGSLEAVPEDWPPPAAVTLFEVLEHLPDPLGFLTQLRRRFPRSALLLSVPGPQRWTKLGRFRDVADYPPNHLTRWNERSLALVLRNAGFSDPEILASRPTGREFAQAGIRTLVRAWRDGERVDSLGELVSGYPPRRALRSQLRAMRVKALLGAVPALYFRWRGWSGFSILAVCPQGV